MGIPAFFRWLIRKCPSALTYVREEKNPDYNNFHPNPNGFEIDNLYIDMNGLIHPCAHPENRPQPQSEEEIFENIVSEVNRLFNIARPRKVLMLAIDGVAPRAKMNQQRSRRYKVARERFLKESSDEEKDPNAFKFDSNVITPGTQFMENVAQFLRFWTSWMISKHKHWKNITVIISDSNVPGEGEHKIMDFVRHQRCQEGYDSNVAHCICGLDADLIMLALSTHESNFRILREEVTMSRPGICDNCGMRGHFKSNCPEEISYKETAYQWLDIQIMRRFLEIQIGNDILKDFDFERIVDDWVFINYFIGNDFLPHLPILNIKDGSIELLTGILKETLKTCGYITNNGDLNLKPLQFMLKMIGSREDQILQSQMQKQKYQNRNHIPISKHQIQTPTFEPVSLKKQKIENDEFSPNEENSLEKSKDDITNEIQKPSIQPSFPIDYIKYGEEGWRARYYEEKFKKDINDKEFFKELKIQYILGLKWVLKYYFQGCPDWGWYFPFYHAPYSKEVTNIEELSIPEFDSNSSPLTPIEQLLAVLPPASSHALPFCCFSLMHDENSPLVKNNFYPSLDSLVVEADISKPDYLWILLLPFLDVKILRKSYQKEVVPKLNEPEKYRSRHGETEIITSSFSPFKEYYNKKTWTKIKNSWLFGSAKQLESYPNFLEAFKIGEVVTSKWQILPGIQKNDSFSLAYKLPPMEKAIHGLLPGAILTYADLQINTNRNYSSDNRFINFMEENITSNSQTDNRNDTNKSQGNNSFNVCWNCKAPNTGTAFCTKCGKPSKPPSINTIPLSNNLTPSQQSNLQNLDSICWNCKAPNTGTAFCTKCGKLLKPPNNTTPSQQPNQSSNLSLKINPPKPPKTSIKRIPCFSFVPPPPPPKM